MSTQVISVTGMEPVSLQEAKLQLRLIVDVNDQASHPFDSRILHLIKVAREWAEQLTGRALVTQQLELAIDAFADRIVLPMPPLQTVDAVSYIDAAGEEQDLDPAIYSIDQLGTLPALILAPGMQWPATRRQANAVRVRYTAGYGSAGEGSAMKWAGPAAVTQWMLYQIGTMYANAESVVVGASVAQLPHVDRLLDRVRIWSV